MQWLILSGSFSIRRENCNEIANALGGAILCRRDDTPLETLCKSMRRPDAFTRVVATWLLN